MIDAIQNLIRGTDAVVARMYLALFRERNALITFLFHSLFRNEGEIAQNHVNPLQRTTTSQLRQFIKYYLEHGYRFIAPPELLAGLGRDEKYVMLTFDDGYYNNNLALPILEEFKVPATFFISTGHCLRNKSYWWDVQYRERVARGMPEDQIHAEGLSLKTLRNDQIEEKLVAEFGTGAFAPKGDIDRPFLPAELKDFASHPLVHLGNHTADHAILTNYSDAEIHQQVQSAQDALQSITGKVPAAIAYPNGDLSDRVVEICRKVGIKLGFTVYPQKCGLPAGAASPSSLRIGRFMPEGDAPMTSQCRTFRSDWLVYGKFKAGYLRLRRGRAAK